MARNGYFHGDEYIEYKKGNLAGVYGSSSNRNSKRKSVYNSGNYNKSNNYTYQDYERNHPDRLVCRVCGSVYNKYKYTRCPHCYPKYNFYPTTHHKPKSNNTSTNFKPNWSCLPNYDENYYERNKHRFDKNNRNNNKSSGDEYLWGIFIGLAILILIFTIL